MPQVLFQVKRNNSRAVRSFQKRHKVFDTVKVFTYFKISLDLHVHVLACISLDEKAQNCEILQSLSPDDESKEI